MFLLCAYQNVGGPSPSPNVKSAPDLYRFTCFHILAVVGGAFCVEGNRLYSRRQSCNTSKESLTDQY